MCFRPKYGKPTEAALRYQPGKYVCEGDSIVHLMDVKECIHKDAFNIGQGGDVPDSPSMLGELQAMSERSLREPLERAWLHAGGNYLILWGTIERDKVVYDMGRLIDGYIEIIGDPQKVVVSSLPYVDPKLKLKDRFPQLGGKAGNIKCNEVFAMWTAEYANLCQKKGVKFLNEFYILYNLYEFYGRKIWSDGIHWTRETQEHIGAFVRAYWNVK